MKHSFIENTVLKVLRKNLEENGYRYSVRVKYPDFIEVIIDGKRSSKMVGVSIREVELDSELEKQLQDGLMRLKKTEQSMEDARWQVINEEKQRIDRMRIL
jgi:hypothetical protein